ncbi:muconolactone Delta-isomerase family protein [Nocardia aobensis]|uniref:Muconolactone Delta-isomerase family protein n=1 Tax=Nocardia aobensis TaxID=257277 RepID=A0ABW6PFG8_9NOCA
MLFGIDQYRPVFLLSRAEWKIGTHHEMQPVKRKIMEFLVRWELNPPADMADEERDRLRALERARAAELRAEGILKRLWRIPGRIGVIGLWEADDATSLHDALSSLPMFPWMNAVVESLATHPQERR